MMVPIAMAVLSLVRAKKAGGPIDQEEENFSVAMLLAVAYGASIGGMATIIGSPPNGIFARFMEQNFNDPISLAPLDEVWHAAYTYSASAVLVPSD